MPRKSEERYLDSAETSDAAWEIAGLYSEKMRELGIAGQFVGVRKISRDHFEVYITQRIPPQRDGSED